MKTYIFRIPDEYDLKESFKMFDGNSIILDKPIDHGVFEHVTSDIIPIEEDSYYGSMHQRISDCTDKLMKHCGLSYVADTCGGIQALEIVTDRIVSLE